MLLASCLPGEGQSLGKPGPAAPGSYLDNAQRAARGEPTRSGRGREEKGEKGRSPRKSPRRQLDVDFRVGPKWTINPNSQTLCQTHHVQLKYPTEHLVGFLKMSSDVTGWFNWPTARRLHSGPENVTRTATGAVPGTDAPDLGDGEQLVFHGENMGKAQKLQTEII